jgi:hypothetical protein
MRYSAHSFDLKILDVKAATTTLAVRGFTAMYFEAFDPELLQVHADILVAELQETMAAGRRAGGIAGMRRWVGERLVRAGEFVASEPSIRRVARSAGTTQQAR